MANVNINWDQLDKLFRMQCTQQEVASFFDCSIQGLNSAIERQFGMTLGQYAEEKRAGGKASIRRAQWHKAVIEKNPALLIWLGKQYLGQSDKVKNMSLELGKDLENIPDDELEEKIKKLNDELGF